MMILTFRIIAKANEIGNGKISPDLKKLRIPTEISDILEAVTKSNF